MIVILDSQFTSSQCPFNAVGKSFTTPTLEVLSVNELMSLTGHESESALKTYLNIDRLETSSKASEKIREALKQRAA